MNNDSTIPQTTNILISLAKDLQAFSEMAKKLQKKLLLLAQTKTTIQEEEIEIIDDPETIASIQESMEAYKRGEYETLRTEKDIHDFVNRICM